MDWHIWCHFVLYKYVCSLGMIASCENEIWIGSALSTHIWYHIAPGSHETPCGGSTSKIEWQTQFFKNTKTTRSNTFNYQYTLMKLWMEKEDLRNTVICIQSTIGFRYSSSLTHLLDWEMQVLQILQVYY